MDKYPEKAIFVSYRRKDSQWATRLLLDRLVGKFGKGAVFADIDNIPYGVDFRKYVGEVLSKCWLTVVVIGERWLTIKGRSGRPRLLEEDDLLRTEIEISLMRNIPVIPVVMGKARMPEKEDLPDAIKQLAQRHGTELRGGQHINQDIEAFLDVIDRMLTSNDPIPETDPDPGNQPTHGPSSRHPSFSEKPKSNQGGIGEQPPEEEPRLPEKVREELARIQRSPDAQYLIGRRFLEGQGVERNLFEATKWFRKSAEQGHGEAEYELGLIYEFGRGVPYDHDKAVEWLRKAADNGVDAAKAFLGKSLPRG